MNLVDAMKTGRPLRRKKDVSCYGEDQWFVVEGQSTMVLDREDCLAEDWEVKPDAVSSPGFQISG